MAIVQPNSTQLSKSGDRAQNPRMEVNECHCGFLTN
jgi:hypothetical protein